jgi:S-DNA-T family DNA segregation ATPase FtsK/SpoIIIE
MREQRHWRLDLVAGLLLIAGLLMALALFSHCPADDATTVYPSNPTPENLLGSPGAWLAQTLLESLGIAVYVLLASWFVLVVLLLLRQGLSTWVLRLFGWLLLVPCSAVFAEYWGEFESNVAVPGPGGSVGAWLALWLAEEFQPAGRALILGSAVLLGLLLTLDFLVPQLARQITRLCRRLLRWPIRLVRGPKHPFRRPAKRPVKLGQATPPPISVPPTEEEKSDAEDVATRGERAIPIHHHNSVDLPHEHVELSTTVASQSEHERFADYQLPPLTLLEDPRPLSTRDQDAELRERAALLEKTFTDFGLNVRVVGINTGPVVTQFEIALETGLRVHKVTRLSDDIALNLKVSGVRMVAPIPGKNTVGVEIPNEVRADVRLKEVILTSAKKIAKSKIPLFLGKDSEGRPLVHDLADMPHLLIAGSTGTGKSVCMNAIILSMLMTRRPDEVKMIMIDPKVVELSDYGKIPHLMHPVVTDMKKAEAILAWAVDKMEERYELLRRARVRNIAGFNELPPEEILRRVAPEEDERERVPERMPYIVIVIDELADLMMVMKKEVEGHIIRLAQKSRAAGIHLVLATQKPTVDVVTGLIKSNLPARICFKVVNKSDSRVVLDEMGADKLLGKGDMLFLQPGTCNLIRAQGTYNSNQEIQNVVTMIESEPCYAQELIQLSTTGRGGDEEGMDRLKSRDELYESAIEVIVREGRGSVSLLQRALGIGYGRAARLVDYMAEDGIVGSYNGSSAREVLLSPEQWAAMREGSRHENN